VQHLSFSWPKCQLICSHARRRVPRHSARDHAGLANVGVWRRARRPRTPLLKSNLNGRQRGQIEGMWTGHAVAQSLQTKRPTPRTLIHAASAPIAVPCPPLASFLEWAQRHICAIAKRNVPPLQHKTTTTPHTFGHAAGGGGGGGKGYANAPDDDIAATTNAARHVRDIGIVSGVGCSRAWWRWVCGAWGVCVCVCGACSVLRSRITCGAVKSLFTFTSDSSDSFVLVFLKQTNNTSS
jgi:hypothetical protein